MEEAKKGGKTMNKISKKNNLDEFKNINNSTGAINLGDFLFSKTGIPR